MRKLAQLGFGSRFSVQPLPQPGHACRARFLVWHSRWNGVPISRTEVAVGLNGQIASMHPRFTWDHEGRQWGDLLEQIFDEDMAWSARRR